MKKILGRTMSNADAWFIACRGVNPKALVEVCKAQSFHCMVCNAGLPFADMAHDSGEPMCVPCFEQAGLENEHSDGYHTTPNPKCKECNGGN